MNFPLKKILTLKYLVQFLATPLVFRMAVYFSGVIIVNILSQEEYGTLVYGLSFVEVAMVLSGVGSAAAIEFFATRYKGTPLEVPYVWYGFRFGLLANIGIALLLFLLLTVIPFPIDQGVRVGQFLIWFIIPYGMYGSIQGYVNSEKKQRDFPYFRTTHNIAVFLLPIIFVALLKVAGFVISYYLIYIGLVSFGVFVLGKPFLRLFTQRYPLEEDRRGEFHSYSLFRTGTLMAADFMFGVDVLLLGTLTGSVIIVAEYSVATLIPIALTAIPVTVLQLAEPYIEESKEDLPRLRKFFIRILILLIIINFFFGLYLFFLLAPNIPNLFGREYQGAVPIFRILLIASFISGSFRIPSLQVLATIGKEKDRLYNNLFSGGLHIVLTIPFIFIWGASGAAISALVAVGVGAFVAFFSLLGVLSGGRRSNG